MNIRSTTRWRGIIGVAFLAGAVGLILQRPAVILVAIIGVVYAAYPRTRSPPAGDLTIERTLSNTSPNHEEPIEVSVTVRNTGNNFLADIRIIDGVPPMLTVIGGTPRHAAALRPGGTTTFSYTVGAIHGSHGFEPAFAIIRDISGAHEVEMEIISDLTIKCATDIPVVPIQKQTRRHSYGPIVTDDGGSGLEFHQTREYQRGDAMSRIDWKRYARTGSLTTIEFREERTASIVLCIDCRNEAYSATAESEPHGVAFGLVAAEQLLSALLDNRIYVGISAIGSEFCWLSPKIGDNHYIEALGMLSNHPTFSVYPPEPTRFSPSQADQQIIELQKRLGTDDQLIFISPLPDGLIAETALTMKAGGHAVMVVSPDVTSSESIGDRLARTERGNLIRSLRRSEISVVDWNPNEAFGTALARTEERWNR